MPSARTGPGICEKWYKRNFALVPSSPPAPGTKKPGRRIGDRARCTDSAPRLFGYGHQDGAVGQEGALTSAHILRHPSEETRNTKLTSSLRPNRRPEEKPDPLFHVHRPRHPACVGPNHTHHLPHPSTLPTSRPASAFQPLDISGATRLAVSPSESDEASVGSVASDPSSIPRRDPRANASTPPIRDRGRAVRAKLRYAARPRRRRRR